MTTTTRDLSDLQDRLREIQRKYEGRTQPDRWAAFDEIVFLMDYATRLEHIAEAARAMPEPLHYFSGGKRRCPMCRAINGDWDFPHAPDCPWLVLRRAIAGGESGE